jgi:hypothetical protein
MDPAVPLAGTMFVGDTAYLEVPAGPVLVDAGALD